MFLEQGTMALWRVPYTWYKCFQKDSLLQCIGYTRWLSGVEKNRGKWLWLDKVISEIIKPHKLVLSSSREIGPLKKIFLIAGHTEFYCGSNEPSHASYFKWLDNTFNGFKTWFSKGTCFCERCPKSVCCFLLLNQVFSRRGVCGLYKLYEE